jgi:hypothetical protein
MGVDVHSRALVSISRPIRGQAARLMTDSNRSTRRPIKVHIASFDESYDKRDFWHGAVVVDGDRVGSLCDRLRTAGIDDPNRWTENPEFHGSEIMNRTGPWSDLTDVEQSKQVYRSALQAIASVDPVIICHGVELAKLLRMPRELIAFRYLAEHIDRWAEELDTVVLAVGDETQKKLQKAVRSEFTEARRWSTFGYKGRTVTRIVDTPHFGPSFESRDSGRGSDRVPGTACNPVLERL